MDAFLHIHITALSEALRTLHDRSPFVAIKRKHLEEVKSFHMEELHSGDVAERSLHSRVLCVHNHRTQLLAVTTIAAFSLTGAETLRVVHLIR